jgi:hypothetical protein
MMNITIVFGIDDFIHISNVSEEVWHDLIESFKRGEVIEINGIWINMALVKNIYETGQPCLG